MGANPICLPLSSFMKNSLESKNNIPILEQEVVLILDTCNVGAPEAITMLGKYVDQCHGDANEESMSNKGSAPVSNRANIKAEIKIATVYLKSQKYKEQGIESLEEALLAASQSEATADLAEQIQLLLSGVE